MTLAEIRTHAEVWALARDLTRPKPFIAVFDHPDWQDARVVQGEDERGRRYVGMGRITYTRVRDELTFRRADALEQHAEVRIVKSAAACVVLTTASDTTVPGYTQYRSIHITRGGVHLVELPPIAP